MAATYTLSQDQVDKFHKDGYLLVRAFEHQLVDSEDLKKWTTEVQSWPRRKGEHMPYEEVTASGERQLMRTEAYVDYHEQFRELLCGEALRSVLAQITGDQTMLLFKDKINYKLPGGNGFAAHLDAPAYEHIDDIEHLTANIAVDAATLENGCLEVIRGSHKMEDITFSHGGQISKAWEDAHAADWISVPLQPGDILFFGSRLAHRSGPNRTDESRRSVYATYHMVSDGTDLRERYYVDRRTNFPPEHEREPGRDYSAGWTRYGFAAPFDKGDGKASMARTTPMNSEQATVGTVH